MYQAVTLCYNSGLDTGKFYMIKFGAQAKLVSAYFASGQNKTRIAPGFIFKGLIQYSEFDNILEYQIAGIAYPQNIIR